MSPLGERVREALGARRLIGRGERVMIGVSGGADSVALLHLLCELRVPMRLELFAVHVDHQLRSDSADDARFVERLADDLRVPATIVRRDVQAETGHLGLSLEDAARRVRYDACLQAARALGARCLAMAHTADDQAETVLMRLIRGSGLTGLTGIPECRQAGEITIVRPMLLMWRRDVLAYLEARGLAFRHDATNDDTRFLRNRIRAELLPWIERSCNPNVRALLAQLAGQCRDDMDYLRTAARRQWKRLVKRRGEALRMRVDGLRKQPVAMQRQLVRLSIEAVKGELAAFEFRHWREIERLLAERPVGTVVDLPDGVCLQRDRDAILVRRRPKHLREAVSGQYHEHDHAFAIVENHGA